MSEIGFQPGVYRHYKGEHYLALGLSRRDETDEIEVIYVRLYSRNGLPMTGRLLSCWDDLLVYKGKSVRRFTYVGSQQP